MELSKLASVVISAGLLALAVPHTTGAGQKKAAPAPDVLATVNGKPISKEMFAIYYRQRLQKVAGSENTPQNQMASINELINTLLVVQDAVAKKLDKRPEIAAALELERAQLLTQVAIQDYLKQHSPDDKTLRKEYEKNIAGKSTKEFKARHILVKSEDEAKAIIKQLDGGADFAKLAKEKSTGPSGKTGGDLGWFAADQMVAPFSEAVAKMEKGSYSKAPVKTQFGWHTILLEDMRETPAPSFEQAKSELAMKMRRQALEKYISELREKAEVKFTSDAAGKAEKKK